MGSIFVAGLLVLRPVADRLRGFGAAGVGLRGIRAASCDLESPPLFGEGTLTVATDSSVFKGDSPPKAGHQVSGFGKYKKLPTVLT